MQELFTTELFEYFGYDIVGSDSHPLKSAFELYVKMKREEEEEYPTIEEILSKMKELKEDENEWDDDTIYDAICEWDDKFADDPDWANEEDTDVKDSLRDQVCMHLGLGEFKKEEEEENSCEENYEVDEETGEKFNMARY